VAPFTFDRRWRFPVGQDELWAVLAHTDDFPRWWPWLDGFEADGLHDGARARFSVRPPLPYRLHLTAVLGRVEPAHCIEAAIDGDLTGTARLELAPAPGGSEARLVWSLQLRRPLLVAAERVARPAMVWGHDRIVSVGVHQFRRRALAG
jgi:hypothetical protein